MTTAISLYQIEDTLNALMETRDGGIPPEVLDQFRQELAEYTEAALEKRDNCIRFIRHVENQIQFAKDEEQRLCDRRKRLETALGNFKAYLADIVQQFAPDMRKGPRRLEGKTGEIAAVRNPESVEILDAGQIPAEFVHVVIRIPGLAAEKFPGIRNHAVEYSIMPLKADIGAALKAGRSVPGARSRQGEVRLRIR